MNRREERNAVFVFSALGGIAGGLCCLTPIVMVLLGLASVTAAASLGNVLYGDYKWHFRLAAAALLTLALVVYFRRRGVCSLSEARRQRNRIFNLTLLVLLGATAVYVFWTYVVLHYWGIWAGLPWAQYDESWAIPASAALLGVFVFAAWLYLRKR